MTTSLIRQLAVIVTLAALLGAAAPGAARAQTDRRCFAETGFCIEGRIREFWERNGGLPVFGLPTGPQGEEQIEGKPLQVQWFERNRLELHPESQRPYDVQLGRLGADRLAQQGRDWFTFPKSEARADCRFFAETGHNVCGAILAAWRARGLELDGARGTSEAESLALLGLPLSDEQSETLSDGKSYTVQWFERGRFELHPENQPPYDVQLGLLGAEVRGTAPRPAEPPAPTGAITLYTCVDLPPDKRSGLGESCPIGPGQDVQFFVYPIGGPRDFTYPVTRPIVGSTFTFKLWLGSIGGSTVDAQLFLRHGEEEIGIAAASFDGLTPTFREFTKTTGGAINAAPGDTLILRLKANGGEKAALQVNASRSSTITIAP